MKELGESRGDSSSNHAPKEVSMDAVRNALIAAPEISNGVAGSTAANLLPTAYEQSTPGDNLRSAQLKPDEKTGDVRPETLARLLAQLPEYNNSAGLSSDRGDLRKFDSSLTRPTSIASRYSGPQNEDSYASAVGSLSSVSALPLNIQRLLAPSREPSDPRQDRDAVESSRGDGFDTSSSSHIQIPRFVRGASHSDEYQQLDRLSATSFPVAGETEPVTKPLNTNSIRTDVSSQQNRAIDDSSVNNSSNKDAVAKRVLRSSEALDITAKRVKRVPRKVSASKAQIRNRPRLGAGAKALRSPSDVEFAIGLENSLFASLRDDDSVKLNSLQLQKLKDATTMLQSYDSHVLEPLTLYTKAEMYELFASICGVWKSSGKSMLRKRINKIRRNARERKKRKGLEPREKEEIVMLEERYRQLEEWENLEKSRNRAESEGRYLP